MDTKECEICSTPFERPAVYSKLQWRSRAFCSRTCAQEKRRRTRAAKHTCKTCGTTEGPFHSYTTMWGRISKRGKCMACWNEARKPKRKTPERRAQDRGYSQKYRDRIRRDEPHRLRHSKAWAVKNVENYLYMRMRANCKLAKRGKSGRSITFEQFLETIGGSVPPICPVLGIPMSIEFGRHAPGTPTVDRIDSTRSYEIGNIAIISLRANIIKNMGTALEHHQIADWMDRRLGGPSV